MRSETAGQFTKDLSTLPLVTVGKAELLGGETFPTRAVGATPRANHESPL
jgi:hypothetical protein